MHSNISIHILLIILFIFSMVLTYGHELLQILINSFILLILCLIQQWSCVQILLIVLHMFFYGTEKENQFNNHELLQILINFFILVIFCLIHQQWCKEKLVASHSEGYRVNLAHIIIILFANCHLISWLQEKNSRIIHTIWREIMTS